MKKFSISGMSCAACSARVQKAVSKLDNIETCEVNLLTNTMVCEGTASDKEIIEAVKNAGYGAKVYNENDTEGKESPFSKLKKRLIYSVGVLIVLMYVSMGFVLWNFPLPSFLSENLISVAVIELVLTVVIMIINRSFFISGFKNLFRLSPNMDSLVAIGSGTAFVYSTVITVKMLINGNIMHHDLHGLYFESAAMILTLITVGKMLEAYSKGKTTAELNRLMSFAPKTATLLIDGEEKTVPVSEIKIGDIILTRAGESFAVDGMITEGTCSADESAITGESMPVDKSVGDKVTGATINLSGAVKIKAEAIGEDTVFSKIIKTVNDAASSKAPIARIADRVSGVFVPSVLLIAIITLVVWLITGADVSTALSHSIAVIVISCPCALGLATPVAIMVSSGVGAKNGILYKNAAAIEMSGKIKTVIMDKTGTITTGKPSVIKASAAESTDFEEFKNIAFSLEKNSTHPLAVAVTEYFAELTAKEIEIADFEEVAGKGVFAESNGKKLFAGNLKAAKELCEISEIIESDAASQSDIGATPVFFVCDNKLLGFAAVADTVKPDSALAVKRFKEMGITTVMLTGDNARTASAIAKKVGIEKVVSDVLPNEKADVVAKYKNESRTAMIGDGINDAPALATADLGIAIGAGKDIAIDVADAVLIKNSMLDAVNCISLGRKALLNIKENLFWAFIYNVIGIPMAAGLFGFNLNPMFAAAAMSLSSVSVVTNALRLNTFKPLTLKEVKTVKKTVLITGMMCGHCSARVKSALEKLGGVKSAEVDHEKGTAVITCDSTLSDSAIKNCVEAEGYKVKEIK